MILYNLTQNQMLMADVLWKLKSVESVKSFITNLSDDSDKKDAFLVYNMMVAEACDDILDEITDLDEANQILNKFRINKQGN